MAKANSLDLEIVHTEPAKGVSNDYLKIHKLGRIPAFVGADGYELTESIAIAIYSMSLISSVSSMLEPSSTAIPTMMKTPFNNSYPCLKTTVEKYSHSDTAHISTLPYSPQGQSIKLMDYSHLPE